MRSCFALMKPIQAPNREAGPGGGTPSDPHMVAAHPLHAQLQRWCSPAFLKRGTTKPVSVRQREPRTSHFVCLSSSLEYEAAPQSTLNAALRPSDFDSFVHFFRQASPYIEGHRGRTFVICCPGEVVEDLTILHSLLEDVALLHGLGIRLVLALGVRAQINRVLHESGVEPRYKAGKRVTDVASMQAAASAAAAVRIEVEARLSRGPAVQVVRRHSRSADAFRYAPAMTTVSGNYVAARRMGVVDGVDFGLTGMARHAF